MDLFNRYCFKLELIVIFMNYKLALFDLDGTLVDTLRKFYETDSEVIRAMGGNVPDIETIRRVIGEDSNWEEYYKRFGINDGKRADELYGEKSRFILPKVIPGVKETLEDLAVKRVDLGVASMNPHLMKTITLLDGQLGYNFSNENIYPVKNNKVKALIDAVSRHGLSPQEAVYIGDMAKDVREAKEAGLVNVGVANEYSYNPLELIRSANPDHLFKDIREVKKLFKRNKR